MVETFKNLLLWNQKADDLETWYAAWVLKYYQVCLNDDTGLTLTYLWQGHVWSLMLLYGKKVKQEFSETIVVYDVKVGRCG